MNPFAAAVMMLVLVAAVASAQSPATPESPGVTTKTIEYRDGDVTLQGYLALPPAATPSPIVDDDDDDDRPGVLVVHEWWGLNDYTKTRARMLAELGYVAFAVDMYGGGKTTTDPQQAGAWAGALYDDRAQLRRRVHAGLEVLEDIENVDDDRLAAIGYCFGGTTVVELAYHEGRDHDDDDGDDDLRGVVSFHGSPKPPMEGDTRLATPILLLHGEADPLMSVDDIKAVAAAIEARGGKARLVTYPDAKHAFTNPDAGNFGMDAIAYNQPADEKSWQAMQAFFREVLKDDD